MNGKCIPAHLEIMPQVLSLTHEYKRMHPQAKDSDAYGAAYKALRDQHVRDTMIMKQGIFGLNYYYEGGV